MKTPLQYALLADGSSDKALLPIIRWTLRDLWPSGEFAQPDFFPRKHQAIEERLLEIFEHYRPNLVFVHRDAENVSYDERMMEIPVRDHVVPVVPVKMTEAWLLIDKPALRKAAENPHGRVPLSFPEITRLERLPAKTALHELLRTASEYTGRKLKKFRVERAVHQLAELIEDYSSLKRLDAYCRFRSKLRDVLLTEGWIDR